MKIRTIFAPVVIGLALVCGWIGCRPGNPLNQKISANSSIDHNLWRAHVLGSLSREQWDDFDEAIQEVRLKIMAEHIATLSNDVAEALWQKIDQRPLWEVMQEGFQFKLARLTAERSEVADMLKINASKRTKPGDTESANYLRNLCNTQADELATLDGKIASVKEKLQNYDPAVCNMAQSK